MKTVFTLSMLVLVTVASIVSCKLFMGGHYDISALLTLTSIISIVLTVYVISEKEISLSQKDSFASSKSPLQSPIAIKNH
jgi:hypothetical protein